MARRFPRLGFWTLSTAFWSAFGLLLATSAWTDLARRGTVIPWGPLARVYWLGFLPWVPFTALIFAVVRRWQPQRDHWRRVGLAWSATAGIILLVYVPLDGLLSQWYSGRSFEWSAAISAVPAQAILLDLGLVVGVFAAAHQRLIAQRAARRSHELQALALQNATLSAQLAAARLAMLQAQLEPHFLFNALNTVSALIRKERPDQAQEALSRLSTLLRYATSAPDREQSTVGEELEFAENYLAFQHLRFGDRLVVAVDADAALDTEPTLPLLLQPLIEKCSGPRGRAPRRHQHRQHHSLPPKPRHDSLRGAQPTRAQARSRNQPRPRRRPRQPATAPPREVRGALHPRPTARSPWLLDPRRGSLQWLRRRGAR
jgi:hypothetical protein